MRWEDHSSQGEAPPVIDIDMCVASFKLLPEGSYCKDHDKLLVVGAKYVAAGSSLIKGLDRPGSELLAETRRRKYDT